MAEQNKPLATFGKISLFSDRVEYQYGNIYKSALLPHIDLCAVHFISYPSLLILGAIGALIGISLILGGQEGMQSLGFVVLIIGCALFIGYFLTMRNVLTIYCGSAYIQDKVLGKKLKDAIDFIRSIEEAKKNMMREFGSQSL